MTEEMKPIRCHHGRIGPEARVYLECYELPRARKVLISEGGTLRPTEGELNMLRWFKESAERFGWTEAPPWVARVESWERAQREEATR